MGVVELGIGDGGRKASGRSVGAGIGYVLGLWPNVRGAGMGHELCYSPNGRSFRSLRPGRYQFGVSPIWAGLQRRL